MSEQQIQKVRVGRLAHVGLWTTDVASQARFYRQVMGFDLRATESGMSDQELELEDANVFLSLGDEHHCLGLFSGIRSATDSSRITAQRTRLHHMAFELDTDADLAALAARLKQSDIKLTLGERDGNPEAGDTLWFSDPDGNRIEISVAPDETLALANGGRRHVQLRPHALQHIALQTPRLEAMVDFYTDALGFDVSDWLLRECVWLRCHQDHHTVILMRGKQDIDHIGFSIAAGPGVLAWADYLGHQQTSVLWVPVAMAPVMTSSCASPIPKVYISNYLPNFSSTMIVMQQRHRASGIHVPPLSTYGASCPHGCMKKSAYRFLIVHAGL